MEFFFLCDQSLDLKDTVKVTLTIDVLFGSSYEINLFVISNTTLKADIILDKEFLYEQKLTLMYKPAINRRYRKLTCLSSYLYIVLRIRRTT